MTLENYKIPEDRLRAWIREDIDILLTSYNNIESNQSMLVIVNRMKDNLDFLIRQENTE